MMLDTIDAPVNLWTPQAVLPYLTEAFRTDRALGGRIGPARLKAAMPNYEYSAADLAEQHQAELEANRRGETTMSKRRKARIPVTIEQIGRMEAVLGCRMPAHPSDNWLAGPLLAYPEHRARLVAWIFADLAGIGAADLCRRQGWSLATFKRHRGFAGQVIADRLNRARAEIW